MSSSEAVRAMPRISYGSFTAPPLRLILTAIYSLTPSRILGAYSVYFYKELSSHRSLDKAPVSTREPACRSLGDRCKPPLWPGRDRTGRRVEARTDRFSPM